MKKALITLTLATFAAFAMENIEQKQVDANATINAYKAAELVADTAKLKSLTTKERLATNAEFKLFDGKNANIKKIEVVQNGDMAVITTESEKIILKNQDGTYKVHGTLPPQYIANEDGTFTPVIYADDEIN